MPYKYCKCGKTQKAIDWTKVTERINVKKPRLNINLIGDLMPGNATDNQGTDTDAKLSDIDKHFLKGPWMPNLSWIFIALIGGLLLLWLGFRK